jgi:hypothetical protein
MNMAEEPRPTAAQISLQNERKRLKRDATAVIPSTFIDTWYLSTWNGHIRITFGEQIGDDDYYRAAIVMELKEAEGLATHMIEAIAKRRAKDDIENKESGG